MTERDDHVKLMLRLPANVRDALVSAAKENKRSMNGEIVHRLAASLRDAPAIGEKVSSREETLSTVISKLQGLLFEEMQHSRS